jgi:hypothetical protein
LGNDKLEKYILIFKTISQQKLSLKIICPDLKFYQLQMENLSFNFLSLLKKSDEINHFVIKITILLFKKH